MAEDMPIGYLIISLFLQSKRYSLTESLKKIYQMFGPLKYSKVIRAISLAVGISLFRYFFKPMKDVI